MTEEEYEQEEEEYLDWLEEIFEETERYSKFKPSIFQKIVWIFWPTLTYLKWKEYKNKKEIEK